MNSPQERLTEASQANPCPHCGKPDWCYSIGELTACKRPHYPPAAGWEVTSKTDKEGTPFYAPIREKKRFAPARLAIGNIRLAMVRPWFGSCVLTMARAVAVVAVQNLLGIKSVGISAKSK
jgi:hypothetical protein